jgi:hypothetical protein
MKEGYTYQPGGEYRPLTPHQKKMHKLRYEPRMYEYKMPLPAEMPEMTIWEAPAEKEMPSLGVLAVALLKWLNCLPEGDESSIETAGK